MTGKQVKNVYVENRFCTTAFFKKRNSSLGLQRQTKLRRKFLFGKRTWMEDDTNRLILTASARNER
jgi:hypothetical protein